MSSGLSYCGLNCARCPVYVASPEQRRSRLGLAEQWSSLLKLDITPEQITCLGCQAPEGPGIAICQDCEVRRCGRKRGVATCAHCPDYGCDLLREFWDQAPWARRNLDCLRRTLAGE